MSYSEEVLTAGAQILAGRSFEFKLGRRSEGIVRDQIAAVRHILDTVLPIIAAETPLTYGEQRSPAYDHMGRRIVSAERVTSASDDLHTSPFTTTSDVGWGAY